MNFYIFAFNFSQSFANTFYPDLNFQPPANCQGAFDLLTKTIEDLHKHQNVVIFLDELPWLATKRSNFIQNLDHYWNTKLSRIKNLKLIVCGSAASWMLDKLINAKGGLYNRLTQIIHLQPFDLAQTKEFLNSRHIKASNKQILEMYTVTGGIPHYLKFIKKSKSAIQNIHVHIGNWRYLTKHKSKENGVQIDLILDREDGIINLCEK